MKLPLSPLSGLALAPLLAAACSQNGFVRVTVAEIADGGQGFPSVFQLRSIASDSDGGTPNSALGPLQAAPITFPKTLVVELPPSATSLLEIVEGIDASGNAVLRGSNFVAFSAGSQAVALQVNLTPACTSSLDCDPAAFCQGQVNCTTEGACVTTATTAPPPFSTPCGNGGGRCDEQQVCVTSFGSCGDGNLGMDPLADGGTYIEQCDWGTTALDGGCTGPDGGCNSDTLPNACRTNCVNPYCGDRVVDTGEKCDLGGGPSGNGTEHGCNASCTLLGKVTRIAGNGDFILLPDGGQVACHVDCGQDGPGNQAEFQEIAGIAVAGSTLYVADNLNQNIRTVDLSSSSYTVATLAGSPAIVDNVDGCGANAGFFLPFQPMAYEGQMLVGTGMNVRQIPLDGGDCVTTLAGPDTGNKVSEPPSYPVPFGGSAGCPSGACAFFSHVTGLCADPATGLLYDVDNANGVIHKLDTVAQEVYLLAGEGTLISFSSPTSCVILDGGLYLTDTGDNEIKRINLGPSPNVVNLVGTGSAGYGNSSSPLGASFNSPEGMCTDGQSIYIADGTNAAVRQLDPVTNIVTTLVGGPDAGIFRFPYDCAWDPTTGNLFVSDQAVPAASPDGVGNVIYMVQ